MDRKPKCKIQNIKLLEKYIGENLDDLGYSNDFADTTPKARSHHKIIKILKLLLCKRHCLQ